MRPGLAHAALSRELALRLGLDGRPFTWPAGAMESGWELAAELATLRRLQSQLERSTRQQGERRLLHGSEGGGGEGGGNEDAMPPLVLLSRPASTQHVAERLQENDAAIKALRESITSFDAQVRDAGCRADENPNEAKKKRGPEAVPRSRTEMCSEAVEFMNPNPNPHPNPNPYPNPNPDPNPRPSRGAYDLHLHERSPNPRPSRGAYDLHLHERSHNYYSRCRRGLRRGWQEARC